MNSFSCDSGNLRSTKSVAVLIALWLLMFSASSQLLIISPLLPQIGRELHIADALLGTLITAYAVTLALFALLTGPVSDRVGRRRILLAGSALMSVSLLLHLLATDYRSLLLLRALSGAAGGILTGSCVAYVGDYFPSWRWGWANGWIASGAAAGQIAGLPLGTLIAAQFGFQTAFLPFAVTMLLAFLLIRQALPQPAGCISQQSSNTFQAFLGYWRMLQRREILAVALVFALTYLSISLFVVYFPAWLVATQCATAADIAMLFLAGGFAGLLISPVAGILSDRFGRKNVIILTSLLLSAVMLLSTFVIYDLPSAGLVFCLAMAGIAARNAPYQALISNVVRDDQRGSMMSLTIALGQIGMGLGGSLAGPLYSGSGFPANTILAGIAVGFIALVVWRLIPERRPGVLAEAQKRRRIAGRTFVDRILHADRIEQLKLPIIKNSIAWIIIGLIAAAGIIAQISTSAPAEKEEARLNSGTTCSPVQAAFFTWLHARVPMDADQIIAEAIKIHGGRRYEESRIRFDFRGRRYSAERQGGRYRYMRVFETEGRTIEDLLDNQGFSRRIDGQVARLAEKERQAYSNSLNSVIYFALLPYPLNDPAAQKRLIGEASIKGEPYHKIEVTFRQEGGGVDHEDRYVYWIHQVRFTMDYLAYRFHVDEGGIRFRESANVRAVEGIRFADYINYKADKSISVDELDQRFESAQLEKVSEINLENIAVEPASIGR